jgi:hypothetical protein
MCSRRCEVDSAFCEPSFLVRLFRENPVDGRFMYASISFGGCLSAIVANFGLWRELSSRSTYQSGKPHLRAGVTIRSMPSFVAALGSIAGQTQQRVGFHFPSSVSASTASGR